MVRRDDAGRVLPSWPQLPATESPADGLSKEKVSRTAPDQEVTDDDGGMQGHSCKQKQQLGSPFP